MTQRFSQLDRLVEYTQGRDNRRWRGRRRFPEGYVHPVDVLMRNGEWFYEPDEDDCDDQQ